MWHGLLFPPRPVAFEFHLEGDAEEGPDEDDDAEHLDILHRGSNDDSADDVSGDEELEAQQDGSADLPPIADIRGFPGRAAVLEKTQGGKDHADHDDGNAGDIDDRADGIGPLSKGVEHGWFLNELLIEAARSGPFGMR